MKRLLLLLLVVVVAGCGGGGDGKLVVSAASSLKGAFTAYGGARFSFAGSDELAAQIRQGVKPDVFAAANTKLPDELYKAGLVEKPRVFAGNRLVLAVPAKGAKVKRLSDLFSRGLTLAVGSPDVPVGAYTREVIAKLGPAHAKQVLADIRSNEPDVKGVVGKLTQGAVDAGFVYVTDVEAAKGQLKAIRLPAAISPEVSYGVAVVKGAKHPEAAKKFVDGLFHGAGHDALAKAGFSFPDGVPGG
jgi:molybdate transport system substrate-binding protein